MELNEITLNILNEIKNLNGNFKIEVLKILLCDDNYLNLKGDYKERMVYIRNYLKINKRNLSPKSKKYWQLLGWSDVEITTKLKEVKVKSFPNGSPMNISFWLKKINPITNKLYTEEEANFKIKSQRKFNKEYYLVRGYTEEEAREEVYKFQSFLSKKFHVKEKLNPEKYAHCSPRKKEFFMSKGLTEEEAIKALKKKQAHGSLENYIKRLGEEEGKKKCKERQEKWQNTIKSKQQEEIDKINKSKAITLERMISKYGEIEGPERYFNWKSKVRHTEENYIKRLGEEEGKKKWDIYLENKIKRISSNNKQFFSKISQELFDILYKNIEDNENIFYATLNKEIFMKDNKKIYFYDFTDLKNKKIIEFNGDYWHANPEIYNENDTLNFSSKKKILAKEIWNYDMIKINFAKSKGFDILVVWESEFRENKEIIMNKCLNFLKG